MITRGNLLTCAALLCATTTPVLAQSSFAGAVYVMTNDFSGNEIAAYGRNDDGTLQHIANVSTGGVGAAFDGGEGLDPLISAYALMISPDNNFVFATNAGSNTVSAFQVNDDFSLTLLDTQPTRGFGPNSIAYYNNLLYVTNIDADGVFNGEPDQEGNMTGFRMAPNGSLVPIAGSTRSLGNRPSAIQFSPSGQFLVVSSINAGSSALASGSTDEMVVYGVRNDDTPTLRPIGVGSSTLPNNAEGRNLPSAIGFEIVETKGQTFVVVTEAREFQPDGSPPAFAQLQTGSVSTWRLESNGFLNPINLDVLTGTSFTDGERTACWIEFNPAEDTFFVSNALESTLSSYAFNNGRIRLIDRVAAFGNPPSDTDPFGTSDGWIDLWRSADGQYLYQLFGLSGEVGVFQVDGSSLTLIQTVSGNLPTTNTQGIVAF